MRFKTAEFKQTKCCECKAKIADKNIDRAKYLYNYGCGSVKIYCDECFPQTQYTKKKFKKKHELTGTALLLKKLYKELLGEEEKITWVK